MAALQVLSCLVFPAVARWLCARIKPLGALGPVVVCYAAGILAANLRVVPVDEKAAMTLNEVSVALSIPLLLFSTEVKKWLSLGPTLLKAFGLACLSAIAAASIAGFVFRASTDEWWKISGMLVGVYIGGTPNLNAIGIALETRSETFVLLNAADVVLGGAWLFVLLTVAQRVLLRFMKPFPAARDEATVDEAAPATVWTIRNLPSMVTGLALALACVLVSAGAAMGATGKLDGTVVMLVLTTLGIALSLVERVRRLPTTFEVGEYLLLVFCVAVGSLADVSKLSGASSLFFFVFLVLALAVVFHVALCWLFGVDADSALVSSTAAVFGPAFIPPVTAALKNKALLGPGLTLGLAGFAIGTYVGLFTAWALRSLGG
ncbi:MAG: DUF819 family protein [Myxococcaceae bacterium]|nr:DUF819 family protein [Myxococcaceae bacterium]